MGGNRLARAHTKKKDTDGSSRGPVPEREIFPCHYSTLLVK